MSTHIHILFRREQAGQQQGLLLHTTDVKFLHTDASIGIKANITSVINIINVITFLHDFSSVGTEDIPTSNLLPIDVLSNAMLSYIAIQIQSAHPMWYTINMFPTVPAPIQLEALLGG